MLFQKQSGNFNISPTKAKEELEKDRSIVVLDVRTKREYDVGHIPNSILIPLEVLSKQIEQVLKNKQQKILVYCRSGIRSSQGVQVLRSMGYKNVYNLGGIINWPYDIIKE